MTEQNASNVTTGPEMAAQHTPAQPAAPVNVGTQSSESSKASGLAALFADLAMMGLISAVVSLAAWVYLPKLLGPSTETQRVEDVVVTVNFEAITREQIMALSELVRSGEIEPSDMPKRSKQFTEGLLAKIREQAEQGKIVLRSENVLAAPDAVVDLTDRFRKELQKEGLMERSSAKNDSKQGSEQESK